LLPPPTPLRCRRQHCAAVADIKGVVFVYVVIVVAFIAVNVVTVAAAAFS
jgi:hypothetical protein